MSQTQPATLDAAIGTSVPVVSVKPVVLPAPDRGEDLQVRVFAPMTGRDLPIVVFSHGFGFSMDADGPLVDFWAAHGFVVIQLTHLDSVTFGLAPDDPRTPHLALADRGPRLRSRRALSHRGVRGRARRTAGPRPDRGGRALLRRDDRQRTARRAHPAPRRPGR